MNAHYYPRHWGWVLASNIGEGLPYAIVNTLLVALFADLGMSNGNVAAVTTLLSLPWSLKFLWSPVVDSLSTKRRWMLLTEICLAVAFLFVALTLSFSFWQYLVVSLTASAAIFSATYDISCDGFYMQALDQKAQSFFVGIRSMAYRLGMLLATGGLVWLAGWFEQKGMTVVVSWQITFGIIAAFFFLLALLYVFILPKEVEEFDFDLDSDIDKIQKVNVKDNIKKVLTGYIESIRTFFTRKSAMDFLFLLIFLLTYRLGEAFLSIVSILFLKDSVENGGLGLDNSHYGLLYGTFGILALTIGGILGGIYISRYSLRNSIIPMALALNIPDLLYVYLSIAQPADLGIIGTCVSFEQFGYGFGLTAFTVYLLQSAKGEYSTTHYAFLTALMALGTALPKMLSGYWQENLGYTDFFVRACWLTLPGIAVSIWFVFRSENDNRNEEI